MKLGVSGGLGLSPSVCGCGTLVVQETYLAKKVTKKTQGKRLAKAGGSGSDSGSGKRVSKKASTKKAGSKKVGARKVGVARAGSNGSGGSGKRSKATTSKADRKKARSRVNPGKIAEKKTGSKSAKRVKKEDGPAGRDVVAGKAGAGRVGVGPLAKVAEALRELVRNEAPSAVETEVGGVVHWEENGKLCSVSVVGDKAELRFYVAGEEIADPSGILEGEGGGRRVRIGNLGDINRMGLRRLIQAARRFNVMNR